MRIAYATTDEVNQALAARVAAEFGAVISTRLPKDPPPDGLFDAVIRNLDDMPRDNRSALLEGLRLGKPARPTAVHGYDISDEQLRTLKRSGVAAARRLHAELLRSLFAAARQSREAVLAEDDSTDLTWVNLVK